MLKGQARKRLGKKAKKGFRGFPLATIAFYGPDCGPGRVGFNTVSQHPRAVHDPSMEDMLHKLAGGTPAIGCGSIRPASRARRMIAA